MDHCNKKSTPSGFLILTSSLEVLVTKAKEAPSPHEVKLILLDTNTVFQCLLDNLHSPGVLGAGAIHK